MAELIIVGFKGVGRAADALGDLRRLNDNWTVELKDAVAVYRDFNGTLRLDGHTEPTEEEAAGVGALWGGLVGMLLAIPLTGGASAAAVGAALATGAFAGGVVGAMTGALAQDKWHEEYGLTEDFVRSVLTLIEPGDSAIFALIRTSRPELVAGAFRGCGGQILQTTLTPEQSRKLQDVLDGRRAAA